MRYHEIASGLQVPLSNEEQDVLDTVGKGISPETLDERGQEVARQMVRRGLLRRVRRDDKIVLLANSVGDIWRDR